MAGGRDQRKKNCSTLNEHLNLFFAASLPYFLLFYVLYRPYFRVSSYDTETTTNKLNFFGSLFMPIMIL